VKRCDRETKEKMSGPQCCSNPPSLNPGGGVGHVDKVGGVDSYFTGSPHSKLAVLMLSDVFGINFISLSFFFLIKLFFDTWHYIILLWYSGFLIICVAMNFFHDLCLLNIYIYAYDFLPNWKLQVSAFWQPVVYILNW